MVARWFFCAFKTIILVVFSKFCNLNKNIRIYENTNSVRYLSGLLKNGTLLPNEASVVLTRTTDSIKDIYQMTNPITMNQIRKLSSIEIDDKIHFLKSLRNIPTYNQEIKERILNGDIIVYGSGTPYSSILPSLETKGIADLIMKNKAPKVMIANLKKETNNFLSVSDLVNDLYKYLNRSTSKRLNKKDLLTHLIVNDSTYEESNSITLDEEKILHQLIKNADIFGQNFRPGVAEKLNFDYETLSKINLF